MGEGDQGLGREGGVDVMNLDHDHYMGVASRHAGLSESGRHTVGGGKAGVCGQVHEQGLPQLDFTPIAGRRRTEYFRAIQGRH